MPDIDGVALAHEIRELRDAHELPLMLLSSLGSHGDTSTADFAATLTKPIKPSQLHEALIAILSGQVPSITRAAEAAAGPAVDERRRMRLLVVEDNEVNQQLALLLLEKLGYRADVAGNGVEALEALERQRYDTILMDIEMPEMDGLEATRRIHRRWAREERPHIIAVTANAMQGERELCLQAGMDDYLSKPIHLDELEASLAQAPIGGIEVARGSVDPAVIRTLASSLGEHGRASVSALIDTFLDGVPGRMIALRAGLERGDAETVRREAHTLKGNAASFGADALSEMSRELESAAADDALERAAEMVDDLERELSQATTELEVIREELRP